MISSQPLNQLNYEDFQAFFSIHCPGDTLIEGDMFIFSPSCPIGTSIRESRFIWNVRVIKLFTF